MSGDQLASSFGDPNAQPPTPKQTPAVFPSPVFETPKNNRASFDNSTGWTPRFAEEYSVFNSTPGNLRGPNGSFGDFGGPFTPYSGAGHKHPFSSDVTTSPGIPSHVNPVSSGSPPLHPTEPQHRGLLLSPGPFASDFDQSAAASGAASSSSQDQSSRKLRHGAATGDSGQTATPPPTARKGERKLAPKLDTDKMQDDHDHHQPFPQPDFSDASQQSNIASFVTSSGDMFNYPLSAPAATPGFTGQRGFWDPDQSMAGMDLDLASMGADIFQAQNLTPSQRAMAALNWGSLGQIYPPGTEGFALPHDQENSQPMDQGLPATSKPQVPLLNTSAADQSMYSGAYPTPIDDPFGMSDNNGGVDPGLLFSRPASSSMDAGFNPGVLPSSSGLSGDLQSAHAPQPRPLAAKTPSSLGRSASVKEVGSSKKAGRAIASSPTKSTLRPGLSRSASENRGKKSLGRGPLPALAPAPRPRGRASATGGVNAGRPIVTQKTRTNTGRSSPPKSHVHHRLSSLSSIPETLTPHPRTQAKFTIDANGKARVETTVIADDAPPSTVRTRVSPTKPLISHHNSQWNVSEDDDASSEDDDPIEIPSRNTSFVIPDPRKPTRPHPFRNSRRSISDNSVSSNGTRSGLSLPEDDESEAETVVDETTPTSKAGDAASELRKLRESRQRKTSWTGSASKPKRFSSGSSAGFAAAGNAFPGRGPISPTTLTEASLPTPSTGSRSSGLRCICNRLEIDSNDGGFMVQCERCEMWLHGSCVNLTERTLPAIYICAFCANTPNTRTGRGRDNGRLFGSIDLPSVASSPLAHKSFKFR